jgi:hypothetical protein
MDISLVAPGQVVAVAARILPYLQVSAEWSAGRSSVDDIVRFVLTGQMHLWAVYDDNGVHGHLVTEIKQYPQCKFLTIQYCAMEPGTMEAVEDKMQEYAERFARDAGCAGIEFVGRPGWRKTANQYGYELHSVTYQKIFKE